MPGGLRPRSQGHPIGPERLPLGPITAAEPLAHPAGGAMEDDRGWRGRRYPQGAN